MEYRGGAPLERVKTREDLGPRTEPWRGEYRGDREDRGVRSEYRRDNRNGDRYADRQGGRDAGRDGKVEYRGGDELRRVETRNEAR